MGKFKNQNYSQIINLNHLDFAVYFVNQSEIKQLKAGTGTLTVKDSFLGLKKLVNILKSSLK